tara:strand:- start:193 stop:825 length:633 start_codon:yes stop_codon:yes gene_type:complete
MKITIIDYKMGNHFSLINALKFCEVDFNVSNDPKVIRKSDILLLPGVGSFKTGMKNLSELNLIEEIREHVDKNKKILGICIGMQLLLNESDEFGLSKGLGLIEGEVKRLPENNINGTRNLIPNVSWNKINENKLSEKNNFLKNINKNNFYYFVHSYYANLKNKSNVIAYSKFYNFEYAAIISKNNIFGTQFHLEKSGSEGIKLLKNFFLF